MVIPIVIGAPDRVNKRLLKGLKKLERRTRVETIKTTAQVRSARIVRRVLETCYQSNSSERRSADSELNNSQKSKLIIIIIIIIITTVKDMKWLII